MLLLNFLTLVAGIATVLCRSIGDVIRKLCFFSLIALVISSIHPNGLAKLFFEVKVQEIQ
jgi:hypothetical protein